MIIENDIRACAQKAYLTWLDERFTSPPDPEWIGAAYEIDATNKQTLVGWEL